MKRLILHSVHLSIRLEHGSQMYVCPHGRTTGGRSWALNASTQMTQWNENGAPVVVADATILSGNWCLIAAGNDKILRTRTIFVRWTPSIPLLVLRQEFAAAWCLRDCTC